MPSKRPELRLLDIIENIGLIQSYVIGMDWLAFDADRRTRDAVERCLERISEAASKLGPQAESLAQGRLGRMSGVWEMFRGMPMTRCRPRASGKS